MLASLAVALALAATAPQKCPDAKGALVKVRPPMVQAAQRKAKRAMDAKGVHALDLGASLRPKASALVAPASGDLCATLTAVRDVTEAVAEIVVGEEFVLKKRGRVEDWTQGQGVDATRADKARRLVSDASAALVNGKHGKANLLLNRAIATLFGREELWFVPEALPEVPVSKTAPPATVSDDEAREECPALAKKAATSDELDAVTKRLKNTLDERKVRLFDLKDGETLWTQVKSDRSTNALGNALRTSCGLLHRAKTVEVDVGFVSKRFQVVRQRNAEAPVADTARFGELVSRASEHIAQSRFREAHAVLEELLVLTGHAAKPSATLE